MELTNLSNGKTLFYEADFEQSSYIIDTGFQLNPDLAFGVELPYAERYGGELDHLIDETHQVIGTQRFLRFNFPEGRAIFRTGADGEPTVDEAGGRGLSNMTYKLKYWPIKWTTKSGCPCGIGFSSLLKVPMKSPNKGWSSDSIDSSYFLHAGVPIGETGGLWASAGFSYLGENKFFKDWPRETYIQIYEAAMDIPLGGDVGLFLQYRLESPFFDKDKLAFNYPIRETSEQNRVLRRMSSGWNSLTQWRGYEAIGFRFLLGKDFRGTFLFSEDYNKGDADNNNDFGYVHNAPDVNFAIQLSFGFD